MSFLQASRTELTTLELEMAKHTFADKQKAMPGEASKNRFTLQEDYEVEGEVRDSEESIVELEQVEPS